MYTCINCGAQVEELYRQYSPSVLKVLKCESCGNLADKYIEYDPVIVLVDLILLERAAYRHLLYNSNFKSYWKLMIVIWLGESFRIWSLKSHTFHGSLLKNSQNNAFEEGTFYVLLGTTAVSLGSFLCIVILLTELRWFLTNTRPFKYKIQFLCNGLIVGGCPILLGLLSIIWQNVTPKLHYILIHGYTLLNLLTAYSVVCNSGRIASLISLTGGYLAHYYIANGISGLF